MPRIERLPLMITLALAVIALGIFQASRAGGLLVGPVNRVLDGDTLYVGPTKIRLQGIAAPELDEPFGPEARDFLTAIALGNRARCDLTGEISFDRQVAVCRIDEQDLGRLMIEAGFARDCPRYSGGRYEPFEVERSKRLPLPGYCLGD
jgi:endonuclease YncB( thermonuclease family)